MRNHILALSACLALGACSSAQMATVSADAAKVEPMLSQACSDALFAANIAGLVPGVGAIVPYINAGCATADGLAKLAADPSSTAWVGQLTGEVKALASRVGVKVAA